MFYVRVPNREGAQPSPGCDPEVRYIRAMNAESDCSTCPVCGEVNLAGSAMCAECSKAFGTISDRPPGEAIDVERYVAKMFPWEPSKIAPNLVSGRWAALLLCFALVLIVVLLALFRAPIPSCWEVG
jgi:hypothetical protein